MQMRRGKERNDDEIGGRMDEDWGCSFVRFVLLASDRRFELGLISWMLQVV